MLVLLIGTVIITFTVGAASSGKPTFEYKVLERRDRFPQELLNQNGKEGWEPVAITGTPENENFTFYLKRQIQ